MAASVPDSAMPVAVTVLLVPTCLVSNVAVPVTVNESLEIRSSEKVATAESDPLYVRSGVVKVTVSGLAVIDAVAVGAEAVLRVRVTAVRVGLPR